MIGEGWKISDIASAMNGEVHGNPDLLVRQVLTDSRRLSFPSDTIFVALKSLKDDGHRYIPELFAKGVRVFVVDHIPQIHREEATFILVKSTFEALQDAAAAWRSRFNYPVLAITGSNGKTVVKEWIHQMLNSEFRIVRSPRSYNSQIGVPLSLFYMRGTHQLGVFEAGISQMGEMENIEAMVHPEWGIFTNIGDAHQEHFPDLETKLNEKLTLFERSKHLIYCSDFTMVANAIRTKFGSGTVKLVSWGRTQEESDCWIESQSEDAEGTKLNLRWKSSKLEVHLPFTDGASVENAMHALTFALAFGVGPKILVDAVKRLSPVAMRLELKSAQRGSSLINDAYNSDPQSIRIALDFLRQQQQHNRRIVILSDLEQSGMDESVLYPQLARMLKERNISMLIGIGPVISAHQDTFEIPSYFYPSTQSFISEMPIYDLSDSAILLKGARNFAFENIAHILEERAHDTVLEINLSAIAHNLGYFRKLLRPETKIMTMVKAFGYGAGYHEIANVLEFHHVDWLAVAYADEGVELRKAGVQTRIMVMNPGEDSFDQIIKYKLEPEIYSFNLLRAFHRAVQHAQSDVLAAAVPVHIKIETGMNRLGFEPNKVGLLVDELLAMPGLRVATVFSHLAASDDTSEEKFTRGQIAKLEKASEELMEGLGYPVIRHILNSSGIHNYIDAQLDMVRLGIGLYGVSSVSWERHHLERVSRLTTKISQIHQIGAGDTVGYGRSFKAEHAMKVATLPVGYADGIDRRLGNGRGEVWLKGQRATILGRVCMDMIMVDVTTIDCREGDHVEIFGDHISIYEFAERTRTIPYEILTSISGRVKRVYYQD
ncbi:bifunctional UDP-N-acetylmuramoyl-tripeptide:D-alanyl-D-alanine ligase/alanine racemase [Phaeocystidibacter luteus]|uniref:Alanine racemase n=1 Tax=Phaeocystidibacter luteus TaxID=911197 RepID=A0A6N6RKX2_9FLAO|nr:bifunctional UDP-N-acetylmuramoyl-tripeptide:D-alanyl-D-alanine ligase/alanine racemase [Phaeocystidibacter luteus]KAB2814029.1 bifunctional UDP-N-acetylmuramoyl-tripeptide:D-alanyl-D-alanine ligase/alanine racemase [Phaeocystidibacter luteus]